jgi:hypothetical protein
VDPEDLQSLSLKEYLICYLSPSPETAVRAEIQKQPEIAARAMPYLDQLEIDRILKEPDSAVRVERLMPYFLSRSGRREGNDAYKGIIAAGGVAGPYLRGVYDTTRDENLRDQIIRIWGKMRYSGCTDLLIKLLATEDEYWARQDLKPGWWNADSANGLTSNRRDEYGKVYSAVYALAEIGDARARPAIEKTRARWAAIHFDNPQIVEECDRALKIFAAGATTKP